MFSSTIETKAVEGLKYRFCNKVISERWNSDQLNTFTTYLSSLLGVIAEYNSNHAQKWGQICCKSVQLVRASSFRNDLLQNPYFNKSKIFNLKSTLLVINRIKIEKVMARILMLGLTKESKDVYKNGRNTRFWLFSLSGTLFTLIILHKLTKSLEPS